MLPAIHRNTHTYSHVACICNRQRQPQSPCQRQFAHSNITFHSICPFENRVHFPKAWKACSLVVPDRPRLTHVYPLSIFYVSKLFQTKNDTHIHFGRMAFHPIWECRCMWTLITISFALTFDTIQNMCLCAVCTIKSIQFFIIKLWRQIE